MRWRCRRPGDGAAVVDRSGCTGAGATAVDRGSGRVGGCDTRNRGLLIVMTFHDTLLCGEYTQDGSLGFVDEDVADAAASLGGAFGGCRAGVGGVAGGADAPLREGGLRLRRRRTTRPVHLLHAETCWSGPVKVCAREFGGGGACASGSGRAGRRGGDRDLGDQRRTAGAAGVDIADDRYRCRAEVGSGRVRACGSGCGAGEYGDGDPGRRRR